MHSCIHAFMHSGIHSFIHFIHSFLHSFIHSFIHFISFRFMSFSFHFSFISVCVISFRFILFHFSFISFQILSILFHFIYFKFHFISFHFVLASSSLLLFASPSLDGLFCQHASFTSQLSLALIIKLFYSAPSPSSLWLIESFCPLSFSWSGFQICESWHYLLSSSFFPTMDICVSLIMNYWQDMAWPQQTNNQLMTNSRTHIHSYGH